MMLYEKMMDECVLMEKKRTPDGKGGWTTDWIKGVEFKAAIEKNSSLQAQIAEKEGLTEVYTITTFREQPLEWHDIIQRVSDAQCFRVTSNTRDNTSPAFSGINFGQVTAEAWTLE